MHERRVPVLFLDIDGTVRESKDDPLGRFVNGPEDVRVFPGVPELLQAYKALGWRIVGVSNQGGVALGLVSLQAVAEAMQETWKQCGHMFDKIAFCIHHPDATEPEMAVCWCRKPRIGLALDALFEMHDRLARQGIHEIYPPHLGLFVGDRDEDAACAHGLNVRFMPAVEWRNGRHMAELRR